MERLVLTRSLIRRLETSNAVTGRSVTPWIPGALTPAGALESVHSGEILERMKS